MKNFPSILFINRVYPPEAGATGRVLEYIATGFAREGWDVSVLTGAGNKSVSATEFQHGVSIIRVGEIFHQKNLFLRALGYLLMIPSLFCKALFLPRSDVIVTMTDPPMLLLMAPFLSFFKGSRLIHWAQDVYPEIAVEVGLLTPGGLPARVLRTLSTAALQSHDEIIVVGRCMAERFQSFFIPPEKIRVISNAGVEKKIQFSPDSARRFRQSHGLDGFFIVEYSGNLGRVHEFQTILEAAHSLKELNEQEILFLFIGEGAEQKSLQEKAQTMSLRNLRFLPSQPPESLGDSLGAGDLHLVSMRESMEGLVVPSKYYGVMAAGKPALFIGSADAEVARAIKESQSGEVITPGDSGKLVEAILNYKIHPQLLFETGKRARDSVQQQDSLGLLIASAKELLQ